MVTDNRPFWRLFFPAFTVVMWFRNLAVFLMYAVSVIVISYGVAYTLGFLAILQPSEIFLRYWGLIGAAVMELVSVLLLPFSVTIPLILLYDNKARGLK